MNEPDAARVCARSNLSLPAMPPLNFTDDFKAEPGPGAIDAMRVRHALDRKNISRKDTVGGVGAEPVEHTGLQIGRTALYAC